MNLCYLNGGLKIWSQPGGGSQNIRVKARDIKSTPQGPRLHLCKWRASAGFGWEERHENNLWRRGWRSLWRLFARQLAPNISRLLPLHRRQFYESRVEPTRFIALLRAVVAPFRRLKVVLSIIAAQTAVVILKLF